MIISFQKFLEQYRKENHEKVFKKGTIFYHGTGEDIKGDLRVGGYDRILWTTENFLIARMYIHSGLVNSLDFYDRNLFEKYKNMIDFTDDIKNAYNKIEKFVSEYHKLDSYLRKMYNFYDTFEKEYDILYKKYNDINHPILIEKEKEFDTKNKEHSEKEVRFLELKKMLFSVDTNPYEEINKQILKFIETKYGYNLKYDDRFRVENGKLQPKEFSKGKVYKLKLNRDVKLRDLRDEQDGMYNHTELKLFHKQKELGYDGVIIDDLAQSLYLGNYGHYAFGFFENVFEVEEIIETTHPNYTELEKKN
jgi:hypothetical protein